ncbi:cell division protein ZapA [Aliiroseovarius halocynthiae]|uniref:Cell division protein ZapA n=1 Tax=Aliiroseovarius halocynthiae TaxID=985055 RepID=A0A545SUW3_9RHOB|nr:cell division protein ZapA [Aliiroseovarius halocynthiae]TQV68746.1 cell division protein ZapA [Aliiroseovarius halocynthiae]SMR71169.1 cell division protein ZapA [Aliiroseovarius halocynthiae]
MPDVTITIGNRSFEVACQEGEEHFLKAASSMLDTEAAVLVSQISNLTESRMLLMSGLMLADKTAGMEDKVKLTERRVAELERELEALKNAEPQKVEVPVVPAAVTDTLAEIAARTEAMAASVEDRFKAD